jgi:hypothetical protein
MSTATLGPAALGTAQTLTSLETFWARNVLSSFTGASTGFTVEAGEVDYVEGLRRFMATASDKACLGIRVAFLLVVTSPLWAMGRFARFSRLSATDRAALMDRLLSHRFFFVRELCLLLKLIACMAIFRVEGTRARTSYDPAPRKRSLAVLRDERAPSQSGDFPTSPELETAVGGAA